MFSFQQNQRTRGPNRFCPEAGGGDVEGMGPKQHMHTPLSKCKNDKIKQKTEPKINHFIYLPRLSVMKPW
jgi:hypothetical protein